MRFLFSHTSDRNQYSKVWTNRWIEPGHVTDAPIPIDGNAYPGNVQNPNAIASHMYQRADYIRLKDLSISYTVPRAFTQRYGIETLNIFARGSNLYTWTDYGGTDPEFVDFEWGTYPQGRTVTFGLRTNF